jgi:hypothetical protein
MKALLPAVADGRVQVRDGYFHRFELKLTAPADGSLRGLRPRIRHENRQVPEPDIPTKFSQ